MLVSSSFLASFDTLMAVEESHRQLVAGWWETLTMGGQLSGLLRGDLPMAATGGSSGSWLGG